MLISPAHSILSYKFQLMIHLCFALFLCCAWCFFFFFSPFLHRAIPFLYLSPQPEPLGAQRMNRNKSSRVQAVLLGCANVRIPCFSLNMSSCSLSSRHVATVPLMSPRILSSGSLRPAPPAPLGLGSSDPGSFLETSVLCQSRDPDSPGVWPNFTAS